MVRGEETQTEAHIHVADIIAENERRNAVIDAKFNPITGEGSVGKRVKVCISDFPLKEQWLPETMMRVPLIRKIIEAGSIEAFHKSHLSHISAFSPEEKEKVVEQFVRVRMRHDFPFWAAAFISILSKIPGEGEIKLRLSRPQRRFVEKVEKKRIAGKPIRLVLLKARQWGGSTVSQLYMAWLQLVHKVGLNSIIISQTKKTSFAIKEMYDRALRSYPTKMLHALGESYSETEAKMENIGLSGDYKKIPQRDCSITIASYEAPDAVRGMNYSLVHCSEVGLWKATEAKTPESVVRAACSGVLNAPYTMIIYESTAKGAGNFFHREYVAAKEGKSLFESLFISWFDIDNYSKPFASDKEKTSFAARLYDNRFNEIAASDREEPGSYLWWLWEKGATLEAINWYIEERRGKNEHAVMASEYPSDDIEAFTFSGRMVFSKDDVEQFRPACRPPKWVGEIYGKEDTGEYALKDVAFRKEQGGRLSIWQDVERDTEEEHVSDRYLVVVDVCKGHTAKADYAVIAVFDRIYMMDADRPSLVAQWYGHIDMDLLAWKAAQVAAYYNNALLVIESNTLETNNTKGDAEYILNLIRDVYPNLYARKQSAEDIREKAPRKYGFHTNTLTKKVIIHNLRTALREHLYTERDAACLDEYLTYIENDNGGYEAMEGYHDDRLMTRAIGLYVCFKEMDVPEIKTKAQTHVQRKKTISAATL